MNWLYLQLSLILLFLKEIKPVGIIDTDISLPVTNTITNTEEYSDYSFRFSVTTKLVKGGYIQVVYPLQFESGLGIPFLPNCTVTCTRNVRAVNFYFAEDLFPSIIYNMTIRNVKNPSQIGGTSQFIIRSYRGANIIDENLMFGILGFGGSIGTLTSTTIAIDGSSSSAAGDVSKYIFSFKTDLFLPQNTYLKFNLPKDTFEVSKFPSCSSFPINGNVIAGVFSCEYNSDTQSIEVRGIAQTIDAGKDVGVLVSIKNPKYSYTTGAFEIYAMKEGTTLAFTRKLDIKGVSITAGSITQIALLPVDTQFLVSRNKLMWYSLSFKLKNPLITGSLISVKLPSSITLANLLVEGTPVSFYVKSGLEDISDESPLVITNPLISGTRFIRISNFKSMDQPNLITINMLVNVPPSSGESTPIEIYSYTDSLLTSEIDKDVSTARVNVGNYNDVPTHTETLSSNFADGTTLINIDFQFSPLVTIPGKGSIKVLLDQSLTGSGVTNSNCRVFNKLTATLENSPLCSKRDREIFIKMTKGEFTVGVSTNFQVNGVIRSPELAGYYFLEVIFYSEGGAILGSYTAQLQFLSKPAFNYNLLPVPNYSNEPCVHELFFSTPYFIPESKVQLSSQDLVSFLKISYTVVGPNTLLADLGYATAVPKRIPCKSLKGLNPVVGTNINCTLYPDPIEPYIIVRNFKQVAKDDGMMIMIPHVANPTGTFTCTVKIITKQNRLLTVLATVSGAKALVTITPATKSGLTSTLAGSQIDYAYAPSTRLVSSEFTVTFPTRITQTVQQNQRFIFFMPKYDVGFLPDEGVVTCSIHTSSFNCYQFGNGLDWIYGGFSSDQSVAVIATDNWKITNLRWPTYVITPIVTGLLEINIYQLIAGNYLYDKIRRYDTFVVPVARPFTKYTLNVDKKRRLEIDVTYTFSFVCPVSIPAGGSVILTLPTTYNLIASFPPVKISYPEFDDLSSTQKLTHIYTANTITIFNIREVYKNNEFRIIIQGMRNPDVSAAMNAFTIEVQLGGFLVATQNNFLTVTLEPPFTPSKIDILSIATFPSNRQVEADYTFAFMPTTKLPVGAEIHIRFPSDYTDLPQNPSCGVSGGVNTFDLCYKLVNEIIMKLDSEYFTDPIYVKIKGISNPNVAKTNAFVLYTYFDGAIVDETKVETLEIRKVSLTPKASSLSIREFYFDPINEGEIALYVISFIPTNNIAAGLNIYIRFPDTFDLRLGKDISISVVQGLSGDIKTKLSERVVTISGFSTYETSSGKAIRVQIDGVVNPYMPESGHSGYISVGTISPDSFTFLDYANRASSVQTTAAPTWLTLNKLTYSNSFSRTLADYQFNITCSSRIPRSEYGGKIIVDLPRNFEVGEGTLKSLNQTTNLGLNVKATQSRRLISVNNHPAELTGDVAFTIQRIKNPLDQILSESFFLRSYDGFSRQIIQRSFENLDPIKVPYKFPGPLVIVNDDNAIFVERGTQSKDLFIVMTEICALNLAFVAITPGFSTVPSEIRMNIGEIRVKFRVSVPLGFTEGEYYVEWLTKNDQDPPIYTPIKKTKVVITGKGSIPISISTVNDVPYKGNSLPILFQTDYAPDIGVEILVSLDKIYPGVSLNKQSVQFLAGTNLNTFMIYFSDLTVPIDQVLQSGSILLTMIGVNKDTFALPTNKLTFNIISPDVRTPEITDMQLIEVTQTTAKVLFTCSDLATAYYIIALKGTAQPTMEEMRSQGPPEYDSTETVFGINYVGKDQSGIISFTGLRAETEYVVYILLEDRGFNIIEAPGMLEFRTKNRYNAAFLTVRFKQNYLNNAERGLIANKLAFLLSLNSWKILESKYNFNQGTLRRLLTQDDSLELADRARRSRKLQDAATGVTTSVVTFTVLAEPTSAVYPPPIELAKLMNKSEKKAKMVEFFSNFDISYNVVPVEFIRYQVGFSTKPAILNVTANEVLITCNLDNFGFVYAVCVKKEEDLGKPSSYQISTGLSYRNIPLPSNSVEISEKFIAFQMLVAYLDPDTDYNMYVTGGSAHPGYPDLMDENLNVFLEFKTLKANENPKLSIESANTLSVAIMMLLALFLLL